MHESRRQSLPWRALQQRFRYHARYSAIYAECGPRQRRTSSRTQSTTNFNAISLPSGLQSFNCFRLLAFPRLSIKCFYCCFAKTTVLQEQCFSVCPGKQCRLGKQCLLPVPLEPMPSPWSLVIVSFIVLSAVAARGRSLAPVVLP